MGKDYAKLSKEAAEANKEEVKEVEAVTVEVPEGIEEIDESEVEMYAAFTGVTKVPSLNIRTEPSLEAEILGVIGGGTEVTVLNEVDKWYNVKTPVGVGFTMAEFVDRKTE